MPSTRSLEERNEHADELPDEVDRLLGYIGNSAHAAFEWFGLSLTIPPDRPRRRLPHIVLTGACSIDRVDVRPEDDAPASMDADGEPECDGPHRRMRRTVLNLRCNARSPIGGQPEPRVRTIRSSRFRTG